MDVALEVLTDFTSVEQILPDWRALADRAARSPLEAPDWLLPLARGYHASQPVRVLAWRHGGELVGVAPFSIGSEWPRARPLRQLAPWGTMGPRLRGLVDVVATDERRVEVLDSLCAWLRASREWDVLWLVRPQFGSTTPARLRAEAQANRWAYVPYESVRSTTYQVELPASEAAWAEHLDKKERRTMRARARRFAEFRHGTLEAVIKGQEVTDALDVLERLVAQRFGDQEVNFRGEPLFRPLLHEAVPRLVEQGAAWVSVARDDMGIVAGIVSVTQNGNAMSLLMAATPDVDYRPFSLGGQIHDVAMGEAVRRGCHTYDLLWVGGYKETFWHAQPRLLESAVVGRGLIGRLAAPRLAKRILTG